MSCIDSDASICKNVYRLPSGIITKITYHSFPVDTLIKSNNTFDFPNFTWKDFDQVSSEYFMPENSSGDCIEQNEIVPIELDKSLQIKRCTKFDGMTSKTLVQSTLREPESANLTQQKRMVKALHNYCLSPETVCPLTHLSSNVTATAAIKSCTKSSSEDVLESENIAQQRRMVEALHNYCRCPKREEENRIATKKKLRQYAALVNKQKKKIHKLKLQVQMLERSVRCKE